jgi:hypothetical protein
MKKNEYSKVTLSQAAQDCLQQLHNTLVAKQYAKRTIRNYIQEMRFLFAHYPDAVPCSISQQAQRKRVCQMSVNKQYPKAPINRF